MPDGPKNPETTSKSRISRRDFINIAKAVIPAAVLATQIKSDSLTTGRLEERKEKNDKAIFSLDKEITEEEIEKCKKTFAKISLGIAEIKHDPGDITTEEYEKIEDFNNRTFIENTDLYVDGLVRLQHLYKAFGEGSKNVDSRVRAEAVALVSSNFEKLSIPINAFLQISDDNVGLSEKDLAFKLLFDTKNLEEEVPLDPLIGMQVYSEIGVQSWFYDFDIKYVEGKAIATYPFTARFLRGSGNLFSHLIKVTGLTHEEGQLPDRRPEKLKIGGKKRYVNDSFEIWGEKLHETADGLIPVNEDVREEILGELEKCGIERATSYLAFRTNPLNPDENGFVFWGDTEEAHVLLAVGRVDRKYFMENKDALMYVIKHEIFHVLVNKIGLMSDFDAYETYATLNLLFRNSCYVFGEERILNDEDLLVKEGDRFFAFSRNVIQNVNEAFRNRYASDLQTWGSLDLQSEILGYYSATLYSEEDYWVSSLLDVDFESEVDYGSLTDSEKREFVKKKLEWTIDHVKYVYESSENKMTNLEKFVCQEIIALSKKGSIFSEIVFNWMGRGTNGYVNSFLPGFLMYSSVLREDGRFVDAVLTDIETRVKGGFMSPEKSQYIRRKIERAVNAIREENRSTLGKITEEYLADQFTLSLTDNIGYDYRNPISSLKSHAIIEAMRPKFRKLLEFFKSRNLALKEPKVI